MTRHLHAFTAAGAVLALAACTGPATTTTAPAPTVTAAAPSTTATTAVTTASSVATTAASSATAPASTATATVTVATTPSGTTKPGLSTAGYLDQKFGTAWHETATLRWLPGSDQGPAMKGWEVVDGAGQTLACAPAEAKDKPVTSFQTTSPGIDTVSGIHVGSPREDVLKVTNDLVKKNEIQEAYAVEDASYRLTFDLEPSTGKVAVMTVTPVSSPRGSFYRMGGLCGG